MRMLYQSIRYNVIAHTLKINKTVLSIVLIISSLFTKPQCVYKVLLYNIASTAPKNIDFTTFANGVFFINFYVTKCLIFCLVSKCTKIVLKQQQKGQHITG